MDTPLVSRVREAIASTGLTQDALAAAINTTSDKLSKSLNGKRKFTTLELALIAETTGCTVDWLLNGTSVEQPAMAARTTIDAAADAITVSAIVQRYHESDQQLRHLYGRRELKPLPTEKTPKRVASWATAQLASSVDGLSNTDLIDAITRAFDIDVVVEPLPDGLDGFAWQTATFRLIGLDTTPYWARQRFTIAHELGHILLSHAQELIAEEVEYGNVPSTEAAANTFAAEFLMPEPVLRAATTSGQLSREAFIDLANRLRVSPIALSWRALNLGIVDRVNQPTFGALSAEKAALEAGNSELVLNARAESQSRRLPRRIAAAHLAAFQEAKTSARPLAQLLGIPPEEVLSLFAAAEAPGQ
jgi:Zn-dependent peptidase ImmA (M78 family)/transcriptional regulator with XRE-family HTH domain